MNKILTVPYPNFSIILPGTCNAKCTFCTWTETKTMESYLKRVKYVLDTLPNYFISVSVTGGEPLMSPYFWDVVNLIEKPRWERVGVTTNGSFLTESVIDKLQGKFEYINISRHHYSDEINNSVFNIQNIPSTKRLKELCRYANKRNIPISLNCVLSKHLPPTVKEIKKFVTFAKNIGAHASQFRKIQGPNTTTAPTLHEELFMDDDTYMNHPCPVCRRGTVVIDGMDVQFKSAVLDPSQNLKYWFEAVLHPLGQLSGDWDGTMLGEPNQLYINPDYMKDFIIDDSVEIDTMSEKELVRFIKLTAREIFYQMEKEDE